MNRSLYLRKLRNLRDQVDMMLTESEFYSKTEDIVKSLFDDLKNIYLENRVLYQGKISVSMSDKPSAFIKIMVEYKKGWFSEGLKANAVEMGIQGRPSRSVSRQLNNDNAMLGSSIYADDDERTFNEINKIVNSSKAFSDLINSNIDDIKQYGPALYTLFYNIKTNEYGGVVVYKNSSEHTIL